jgi:hypothetical protein
MNAPTAASQKARVGARKATDRQRKQTDRGAGIDLSKNVPSRADLQRTYGADSPPPAPPTKEALMRVINEEFQTFNIVNEEYQNFSKNLTKVIDQEYASFEQKLCKVINEEYAAYYANKK